MGLFDSLKVKTRLAARMAEERTTAEPVEDQQRAAIHGAPPVPGAQWDELHGRWEHWDDATQAWVVVDEATGEAAGPAEDLSVPANLVRIEHRVDELDEVDAPVDEDRAPEPDDAPPGAQWNEVEARWERWDDAAQAWVAVEG